jgi:hypothetical protein
MPLCCRSKFGEFQVCTLIQLHWRQIGLHSIVQNTVQVHEAASRAEGQALQRHPFPGVRFGRSALTR